MVSVHHLLKQVAGPCPNPRPAWFFDVAEQGGALVDIATHLIDLAQRILCPERALDFRRDIRLDAARHWPTPVSLAQFRQLTGEARWPDALAPSIAGDQTGLSLQRPPRLCAARRARSLGDAGGTGKRPWVPAIPHHTVFRGSARGSRSGRPAPIAAICSWCRTRVRRRPISTPRWRSAWRALQALYPGVARRGGRRRVAGDPARSLSHRP